MRVQRHHGCRCRIAMDLPARLLKVAFSAMVSKLQRERLCLEQIENKDP